MNRIALFLPCFVVAAAFAACGGNSPDDVVENDAGGRSSAPDDGGASITRDGSTAPHDAGSGAHEDSGTQKLDAATLDTTPISSLSGLVLWLDAEKGIGYGPAPDGGSAVGSWADQSSAHNIVRADTEASPTLGAPNGFGGHQAFHFTSFPVVVGGVITFPNPVQFSVNDSTSLDFGGDDIMLAVVTSFTNDTNGIPGSIFDDEILGVDGPDFTLRANGFTDGRFHLAGVELYSTADADINVGNSYNDGTARLIVAERAAGVMSVRVNGSEVGSQAMDSNPVIVGSNISIGGKQQLDGDIAEIVVVRGVLPSDKRNGVEAYLMKKYGF